jgi:type II secretory pathway component PulF
MQKYKITATKNQKKYTLVLSAESQKEAQEKVHKEGYSILKIEEYDVSGGERKADEKKFVFL